MKNFAQLILICALALVFSAPISAQEWWGNGIKGTGPIVKKSLNVNDFQGFGLAISGNVFVQQGSKQSVTVEGQQNIIDNMVLVVENGYWKIRFNQNVRNLEKLNIYITIPTLNAANLSGSGDIKGQGLFKNLGDLQVSISGSGNINLEVEANAVDSKVSGSGNIKLGGKASSINLAISGSGDIFTKELEVNSAQVQISGSGNANVYAKDNLNVKVSGSGDVYYRGRPRLTSKVSGSGEVSGLD
jgi:hypothetical protein